MQRVISNRANLAKNCVTGFACKHIRLRIPWAASPSSSRPMTSLPLPIQKPIGVWRQRFGYGVADFACNLVWQMMSLYLMFFYTDVVGLVAAQVGIMFLVTRLVDGIADVCMGLIIDKTESKWGKSRPWFLWGAIPFGILSIAPFYVPKIGLTGELIYAFITYLGLSLAYTVVGIPLSSILPSLTRDPQERTMLATVRMILAILGSTTVSICTLPLVKILGGDSRANGFLWTMVIFAVSGTAMFIYTFFNVEEKYTVRQEHMTIKRAFSSLKGNTAWYIFAVNIVFLWGAHFLSQGTLIYYFTYNVGRPDLAVIAAGLTTLVPLAGAFSVPLLARWLQKRTVYMIACVINLAGIGLMILANAAIVPLMVGLVISVIGFGLLKTIYFSMQADPVDFGEWKTGISAPGMLSSVNGFITKVALAFSGMISGAMLSAAHYVPNQPQQKSALLAIKLNYLVIPAGLTIVSMIVMSFYHLDKIYPQIRADINTREKAQMA